MGCRGWGRRRRGTRDRRRRWRGHAGGLRRRREALHCRRRSVYDLRSTRRRCDRAVELWNGWRRRRSARAGARWARRRGRSRWPRQRRPGTLRGLPLRPCRRTDVARRDQALRLTAGGGRRRVRPRRRTHVTGCDQALGRTAGCAWPGRERRRLAERCRPGQCRRLDRSRRRWGGRRRFQRPTVDAGHHGAW
jgi:hypothetical protein